MARKKAPAGSQSKRDLARPFIAEWRKYRNDISQERLAERVGELLGRPITAATISRVERGKSPYSQRQLEAIAEALGCTPADLLMRDPTESDSAWSLLESLKPETRERAVEYLQFLRTTDDKAKAA